MDGLSWKTLSKWMIWGYHYFRKHPDISKYFQIKLTSSSNKSLKAFKLTSPKTNMEPEKGPLEKARHLHTTIFGFHVSFGDVRYMS